MADACAVRWAEWDYRQFSGSSTITTPSTKTRSQGIGGFKHRSAKAVPAPAALNPSDTKMSTTGTAMGVAVSMARLSCFQSQSQN